MVVYCMVWNVCISLTTLLLFLLFTEIQKNSFDLMSNETSCLLHKHVKTLENLNQAKKESLNEELIKFCLVCTRTMDILNF